MNVSERVALMVQLGKYISENDEEWQAVKEKAHLANGWFCPEFIELATKSIVQRFLQVEELERWVVQYPGLYDAAITPRQVGIVMAGNVPLVGFHDFLCVFISGHTGFIKPSSKDEVLIKHLVGKLIEWIPQCASRIVLSERLNNCDAYIATGSNNTSGYFEYYFGKYPNIIRNNRTSVALISGCETDKELSSLAGDVFLYYGMGCRNVTKLYVPKDYDFVPLIATLKKYDYLADHHKYKNNYDYNLALHILNNKKYMSTASLLLVEDENIFSPVSQIHYEHYRNIEVITNMLQNNPSVQCVIGHGFIPFGYAQTPTLIDYADGVDTMAWLEKL